MILLCGFGGDKTFQCERGVFPDSMSLYRFDISGFNSNMFERDRRPAMRYRYPMIGILRSGMSR